VITFNTATYAIDIHIPRRSPDARWTWRPGDSIISLRRNAPPVQLSDREHREVTGYLRDVAARSDAQRVQEVARTKPPIVGMQFGVDGRFWVQVAAPSVRVARDASNDAAPLNPWRQPSVYDIYEPDGEYVGRVEFPLDTEPVAMRGDQVWCRVTLEDDVRVVRRLRVQWTR
jgi:hypothetical protein